MSLKSERGSQSILGIGLAVFVLALTLVAASATQLNHQQQRVQVRADALALDLADLLQFNARQLLKDPLFVGDDPVALAAGELSALESSRVSMRLVSVNQIGADQIAVTVCQANALRSAPVIGGLVTLGEICARAQARTTLP
jgi:hypothetical protein